MQKDSELQAAISCARQAGDAIMKLYENGELVVSEKSDGSPVTNADLAAEAILVRGLKKFGYGILSEESLGSKVPFEETFWVVDPIDGTKDLMQGTGDVAVMVGLVRGGEARLGVVYEPFFGKLYFGEKGKGSFVQEGENAPQRLPVAKVPDEGGMRFVASRNHTSPQETMFMKLFLGSSIDFRGSLGVKLGLVAENNADCCINLSSMVHLWDICAPEVILREAGGILTDPQGGRVQYNETGPLALDGGVVAARSSLVYQLVMQKIHQ